MVIQSFVHWFTDHPPGAATVVYAVGVFSVLVYAYFEPRDQYEPLLAADPANTERTTHGKKSSARRPTPTTLRDPIRINPLLTIAVNEGLRRRHESHQSLSDHDVPGWVIFGHQHTIFKRRILFLHSVQRNPPAQRPNRISDHFKQHVCFNRPWRHKRMPTATPFGSTSVQLQS